ncbi:protein kinase [Grosmannia clavigera kw1407]|uniref:dual-specificity kinase n=1 Tax=Grosmannia clavigera (strain kw1407 / UAMH 11150) TaxID=655863 RepID=F0XQB3_GROCL|nr:protein kinase [Grosmannia clavigera kw1407]EFX00293.1 protein kinase [Grosmannia clavigera kw1407]
MSTPTTATATLPQYSSFHPFSHQSSYLQALPAPYSQVSTSTGIHLPPPAAMTNGVAVSSHARAPLYSSSSSQSHYASVRDIEGPGPVHGTSLAENPTQTSTTATAAPSRSPEGTFSRKRRRSGPPDWESFYKNGLPQEAANVDGEQHSAKKRRRLDESLSTTSTLVASGRYDPVYNYPQPSGSTASSERTNSNSYANAAATAANTATSSLASTRGYPAAYEATAASQKLRRTTRQQAANESKKRDPDMTVMGLAFTHYRPPPLPPVKAPEVEVKVIHDARYDKSVKVDDEDGHYIVVPDADLTERYQLVKLLGQGTFGKVVQARDRRSKKLVAIKIIRSVQKYRDASRIELRVLETLKANDRENRNRCIHLFECFDFRGHICIVMDLLGQSIFDFLKGNTFVPFPNSQIQSFARQLFTSVAFLHDLQLIHTDLKPENILLVDANYQTFTYNRKIPSSSTIVARQASQRRVLLDTEIRLIDFGSATFQDEYHSSVVSTRHYRAPEIILGLGWSFPCDIWSIGCILVEFFTGDALFQTHDNLEHLAMMEAVCDCRIDAHLVQQVTKSPRHGGNPASKYFKRAKLNYPTTETTRASRRFVKAMKRLNDIIPRSNNFLKQFLDLLKRIFVYDPAKRITAKEALLHPWFREVALQDDGTVAAKIRQERAAASS